VSLATGVTLLVVALVGSVAVVLGIGALMVAGDADAAAGRDDVGEGR
jgi:hypothetical protein